MTDPREELNRFKTDIDLRAVAALYGYEMEGRPGRSTAMKHPTKHSKLIISVADDGHWKFWDVHDDSYRGTVLDFLLRQEGADFRKVCQKCREYLGSPPVSEYAKPPPLVKRDPNDLFKEWMALKPYHGGYLESRGIDHHTLERFAGKIHMDSHGNACFQHQDLHGNVTGWEKKNKGFTGFTAEGSKALFICRADEAVITTIVICESAIDAMSYYQLNKQPGLYVSFGGAMSPDQQKQLAALLRTFPGAKVHAATDNDPQGETYAAKIASMHPDVERKRPRGVKDWNDALQASLSRSR
jgi:hypothetical protein